MVLLGKHPSPFYLDPAARLKVPQVNILNLDGTELRLGSAETSCSDNAFKKWQ